MRNAALFHGATVDITPHPALPDSVIVIDGEGVLFKRHPVPGTQKTILLLHRSDLTGLDLTRLAASLMALPGVAAPRVGESGTCAVPLVDPDEATADGLLWRVGPHLVIQACSGHIGHLHVELPQIRPATLLTASQVWRLARVLLSLVHFHEHLVEHLVDTLWRVRTEVATELRARRPLPMRIFHHCHGRAVEVFAYDDTTAFTDHDALAAAFSLFNARDDAEFDRDLRTVRYFFPGNRSLSVGDYVSCGGRIYRCEPDGWRQVEAPLLDDRAYAGSVPWTGS